MGARTNSNVDMRTYKSKLGQRRYINYSSEALDEALLKVVNGELSLRKASKQYNIPYGTINNKFHGVHIRKTGGQTALTEKEELALVMGITTCADWGFPFTTIELQMFTKCFLESAGVVINKFKNNTPGSESVRSFFKTSSKCHWKKIDTKYNQSEGW